MSETATFSGEGFQKEPFDPGVFQELQRTEDYSNRDLYPTWHLEKLLYHWSTELDIPERSARSRGDVQRLLGRIGFELHYREQK